MRAGVDEHHQIQPAFPSRDVGDVPNPELVGTHDDELPRHEVVGRIVRRLARLVRVRRRTRQSTSPA